VHIDRYRVGDDTVVVTRGDRDHFSLLVAPPHAGREAALAAVARAVEADGGDSARQILVATGIGPEPPGEES
jgi:transcription termination factor Rho